MSTTTPILSRDEVKDISHAGFNAYFNRAWELRKKGGPPRDGYYPEAWADAVTAIFTRLHSLGYVRPPYTPITNWRHGTIYGYATMGCLCFYCQQAGDLVRRADLDEADLQLEPGVAYDEVGRRAEIQPPPGTMADAKVAHSLPSAW